MALRSSAGLQVLALNLNWINDKRLPNKAGAMRIHLLAPAFAIVLFALDAASATLYVDLNSANPVPPYTNWATAATNIQDAIDAAIDSDLVMVTDGLYQSGGRIADPPTTISNRVAVTKEVTVKSVNGAAATIIRGHEPPPGSGDPAEWYLVNCAYLTTNAALIGFTFSEGHIGVNSSDNQLRDSGLHYCVQPCRRSSVRHVV